MNCNYWKTLEEFMQERVGDDFNTLILDFVFLWFSGPLPLRFVYLHFSPPKYISV